MWWSSIEVAEERRDSGAASGAAGGSAAHAGAGWPRGSRSCSRLRRAWRMQSVQDLSIGGRFGGAQYQYTLQAENLADLNHWAPILQEKMRTLPGIYDVNTDQQVRGLASNLVIDRDTASRLGVNMSDIDNTLGDAFGQRQVSNIYKGLNQYHVVLDVSDRYTQGPEGLRQIYVPTSSGGVVPLSSFAHYEHSNTSLSVNHQGLYPSITLSFNLGPGGALGDAVVRIQNLMRELGMCGRAFSAKLSRSSASPCLNSLNASVSVIVASPVSAFGMF